MRINLLPKEERGRSKSRVDWLRMAWIGVAVLAVAVVGLTVFNVADLNLLVDEEADLFERVTELRLEQSALSRLRTGNNELAATVETLEKSVFTGQNAATARLLADVAHVVPADAWLDFLAVDGGRRLWAEGRAAETGDLSALLRGLKAATDVADVQLDTMERIGGADGYRRQFSVSLTLREADR